MSEKKIKSMRNRKEFSGFVPYRDVPLSLRVQALFGGFCNQFGWGFLGFGLIFFWVFVYNADFSSYTSFRGELEKAKGLVVESRRTSASEDHSRIYEVSFEFVLVGGNKSIGEESVGQKKYSGISYSLGSGPGKGDSVTVEFPKGNPNKSRIKGLRTAMFGPGVAFVVIFPLIGFLFVFTGVLRGLKANRLFSTGRVERGVLKSKIPTNTRINDRVVFSLTFVFTTDDGREIEVVSKTHNPELLEDESQEALLYDPAYPSNALMLDSLPGSPKIDEGGNLRSETPSQALTVLFLPALTILGHGLYIWFFIK